MQCQRKREPALAWERRCEGACVPVAKPRRPGNCERSRSFGDELRVEHKKGHAGEMVGVKMREQNQSDCVAIDAKPFQRDERRGAAIDQQPGAFTCEVKAGVEAAA